MRIGVQGLTVEAQAETTPAKPHRSISQYGTFVRCGEQYRLTKVRHAPETPAAWFYQGTAFHKAIECWEASGRQLTAFEVRDVYDLTWLEEVTAATEREPDVDQWLTGGRVKAVDDIERRFVRGQEQVDAYMAYALADVDWQPWEFIEGERAVEVPFSLMLGDVEIRGSIDQVIRRQSDGLLMVRDLKTGSKLPDTAIQLGVYAQAVTDLFGEPVGWGDYYMAKNGKPTTPYDLSYFTVDRLTRWFKRMDSAVVAGLFLPNPGDNCRTCTVRRFCDAGGPDAHLYREGEED